MPPLAKPKQIRDERPESSSDSDEYEEGESEEYEEKPKPKPSKITKTSSLRLLPSKNQQEIEARVTKHSKVKPPIISTQAYDIKVGFVYTKTGKKQLYETPSKKYYVLRDDKTKSYVTERIHSGKLKVYEA
jgi:hypothetical protein